MPHRNKYRTICAALCLVFVMVLGNLSALAADAKKTADELKERQSELSASMKEIDAEIKRLKESIANNESKAAQEAVIQQQNEELAALYSGYVEVAQENIALKEQDIELQIAAIDQKQKEFDDSYELFCQRLVAMYKMMDSNSTIAALFTAQSVSELLSMTSHLQVITQHDTELLDTLERQRIELEEMRETLEQELAKLEEDRADLQEALDGYNAAAEKARIAKLNAIAAAKAQEEEMELLHQQREAAQAEMDDVFKQLSAMGSSGVYYGGALQWPTEDQFNGDRYISSPFGSRILYGRANNHTGMDINKGDQNTILGTEARAANGGTVVLTSSSNSSTGYGYYVIVDHGGGIRTLYAHLLSISVSQGQTVSAGDKLGEIGSTGNSTGPHLHFEVRIDNKAVNPYPYLTGQKSLD